MSTPASRVYLAATRCGYTITPASLTEAIRTAIMECRDSSGHVSVTELYELTCKLESLSTNES
jgi:flavin-binding protein dodecin